MPNSRLEVNLLRFPSPEEFRPKGLIIRQLLQRWGSMSPASRLLLNRRLIEAPPDAIDYVITHELCHIAVPHHGPEFFELLDPYSFGLAKAQAPAGTKNAMSALGCLRSHHWHTDPDPA